MAHILVTGAAGFIGAHVAAALALRGHQVTGCDNYNAYYDPALKAERVARLLKPVEVPVVVVDLREPARIARLLRTLQFDWVLHLAAQAGVRHSRHAPLDYVADNVTGFANVLEACRQAGIGRLIYASSSSVYGARQDAPFREDDPPGAPVSMYAATKLANEAMAQAYHAQHGLHSLGLRLFTVYGPWGRPDMAPLGFAEAIRAGRPITLYEQGRLQRDFTYIGDAVAAIVALAERIDEVRGADIVNVGHREPRPVIELVRALEHASGRAARIEYAAAPPGEAPLTCACDARLRARIGDWPHTPLQHGVRALVDWLEDWHARRAAARAALPQHA
jgi:UDP-glucuronate 4-epimerase